MALSSVRCAQSPQMTTVLTLGSPQLDRTYFGAVTQWAPSMAHCPDNRTPSQEMSLQHPSKHQSDTGDHTASSLRSGIQD